MKWTRCTEERYHEMLEILPPAVWLSKGFLVGEPTDHTATGRARFAAFVKLDGRHYESSEPLSAIAFKALTREDVLRTLAP